MTPETNTFEISGNKVSRTDLILVFELLGYDVVYDSDPEFISKTMITLRDIDANPQLKTDLAIILSTIPAWTEGEKRLASQLNQQFRKSGCN